MRVLGIDPGLNTTGYGVLEYANGQPRLIEAGAVAAASRVGRWPSAAMGVAERHGSMCVPLAQRLPMPLVVPRPFGIE